jgi:hypothetical protein
MTASSKIFIGLGVTLAAALMLYGPMGFGRSCVIGKTPVAKDMAAFAMSTKS